ncbi:MAG TPA: nucleotide sugar dehydrogenase [Rhodospirillaceae bacterium]|nr:UDP-N-acetyl-D-galactosamine dehydrogenase [Rhodospirillaceae bacterium]HAT36796.1 nucleotide sugar dehydrogenase [Rhodospirillaceae bacterium]
MTNPTASDPQNPTISVVGLGYVGLPLAIALARHHKVIGFDVSDDRIDELARSHDRTGEVASARLKEAELGFTSSVSDIAGTDIFIVAVPTPVDDQNRPDLGALSAASETVGKVLSRGAVVVFESTVYPGVTEDICGTILERESGLRAGEDFFLGYSPERINPGDQVHTVDRITKVVAGQTPEVAQTLKDIYGAINGDNIFIAADIRTAEAAKVIENAQRDINIAFINEISLIFDELGLSTQDVLAAARTKWNFLDFRPGLVGGHCIGVDPYYLAHAAETAGLDPEIVLAGRRINDGMSGAIAERIARHSASGSRVLVLGITFKENVPDIRNSKVADLVRALQEHDFAVDIFDPLADAAETNAVYGLALTTEPNGPYDVVVGAVAHDRFQSIDPQDLLTPNGLLADIKGIWRDRPLPSGFRYWAL